MKVFAQLLVLLWTFANQAWPLGGTSMHFQVIPLGTGGGELEDNLSAYLVAPVNSHNWVALDAGTFCSQIKKIKFKDYIAALLVSHAHLDHISGFIICSTMDTGKTILGTDVTINHLRDHLFNWKIWPNFANEGIPPLLKKYHYQRLQEGVTVAIPNTAMRVQAFPLNHGNHPSTAFLLEAAGYYLLYLGDTGPDAVEHGNKLRALWEKITPLLQKKKLLALFIESSYANERPDTLLFGHMTPKWLLKELDILAHLVNPKHPQGAVSGLNVIVTHIKQSNEANQLANQILQQLQEKNNLGIHFIIPKQGQRLTF
ncbi:3',5'-cyclic-nucleotide phosphodiesterase [Legionella sp. 27cVA30]|uniref:MBL fold metallo-hydrolase n=1 Tax=Legionella sp. 27cVA30 TaxID=2905657 RepID=UPI00209EA4C0|nr:3',5'-cyclic-nucleotide phosphodiesterase [Legionella sp. 27cVA30]MCP0914897.1 3',5'-cyclic-nucleotide phosphodiesterase [Legionella sp. 27cVA30]